MRGEDPKQEAMFSYVSPEQRVPLDSPRRPIREMGDAAAPRSASAAARGYRIVISLAKNLAPHAFEDWPLDRTTGNQEADGLFDACDLDFYSCVEERLLIVGAPL